MCIFGCATGTRVWQKWRFSAPKTHLLLIIVWVSASTFVVEIATFAKPENVICNSEQIALMKNLKKLWTLLSLILFLGIFGMYLSQNIILLKYLFGDARNIGKAIPVKVYADGKINNEIKIFNQERYWNNDKSNCKIFYFPYAKSYTFLCVNYDYNYLGTPISTGEKAFKIIFGNLFQSELGAKSSPIESKLKSLGFHSHLRITEKNTKFILPKSEFGIDSLRIEFEMNYR